MVVVVTDTSGSMREHGKAMLARNLIACVREQRRLGDGRWRFGEPVIVLWGTEATVADLAPDQDLPLFSVANRALLQPLLALLGSLLSKDEILRVLLLSDGHLPSTDVSAFKAWRRDKPGVSVRTLAIGPDAVPATLAKMADRGGVFPPDEVVGALASWTLQQDPTLPTRVGDLADAAARSRR